MGKVYPFMVKIVNFLEPQTENTIIKKGIIDKYAEMEKSNFSPRMKI